MSSQLYGFSSREHDKELQDGSGDSYDKNKKQLKFASDHTSEEDMLSAVLKAQQQQQPVGRSMKDELLAADESDEEEEDEEEDNEVAATTAQSSVKRGQVGGAQQEEEAELDPVVDDAALLDDAEEEKDTVTEELMVRHSSAVELRMRNGGSDGASSAAGGAIRDSDSDQSLNDAEDKLQEARLIFARMDSRGVGYLSRDDVAAAVVDMMPEQATSGDLSEQLNDIMAGMDVDGDGKVGFEDFLAFFNSLREDDEPRSGMSTPAIGSTFDLKASGRGSTVTLGGRSSTMNLTKSSSRFLSHLRSGQRLASNTALNAAARSSSGSDGRKEKSPVPRLESLRSDSQRALNQVSGGQRSDRSCTPRTAEIRRASQVLENILQRFKVPGVGDKKKVDSEVDNEAEVMNQEAMNELRNHVRRLTINSRNAVTRYEKVGLVARALETENQELSKKVEDLEQKLKYSRVELDDVKEALQLTRTEVKQLQPLIPELQSRLEDSNRELENTRALLMLERKSKKSLQQDYEALNSRMTQLRASGDGDDDGGSKKTLKNEIASLKQRLSKMEELEDENEAMKATIDTLERDMEEQSRLITDLREQVATLEQKLQEKTLHAQHHRHSMIEDVRSIEEMRKRTLEAQREKERKQDQDKFDKALQEVNARADAEKKQRMFLEGEVQHLKEKMAALMEENKRLAHLQAKEELERLQAEAKLRAEAEQRRRQEEEAAAAAARERERLQREKEEKEREERERLRREQEEKDRVRRESILALERQRALEEAAEAARKQKEEEERRRREEEERRREEEARRKREEEEERLRREAELKRKQLEEQLAADRMDPADQDELSSYARYFNGCLGDDEELKSLGLMPVAVESTDMFVKLQNGILLAKFINNAVPGTIDERALNRNKQGQSMEANKILENLNLVLSAATSLGIKVQAMNIGAMQLLDSKNPKHRKPTLCLLWHLIRTKLLHSINIQDRPELARLRESYEEVKTLSSSTTFPALNNNRIGFRQKAEDSGALKLDEAQIEALKQLSPEQLLLRWLNHHLHQFHLLQQRKADKQDLIAGGDITASSTILKLEVSAAKDYSKSLCDGRVYLATLESIQAAEKTSLTASTSGLVSASASTTSLSDALSETKQADPSTVPPSASATSTAAAFIDVAQEQLLAKSAKMSRTALAKELLKVCESMNIPLHGLVQEHHIADGHEKFNLALVALIFLAHPALKQLSDKETQEITKAGLLDDDVGDSREERAFRMWMNSSGIDRYVNNLYADSRDGILLLQLIDHVQPGLVDWKRVELKPSNKFKMLSNNNYVIRLCTKSLNLSLVGIGGNDIYDGNKKYLLAVVWQLMRYHTIRFLAEMQSRKFGDKAVTEEVILEWANNLVSSKGKYGVRSFKDSSLRTSLFFLDLLSCIEPRIIDWNLVTKGETEEECRLNAGYTISVARKLGATVFILPEDIMEVKPKMILTLVASIMATSFTDN